MQNPNLRTFSPRLGLRKRRMSVTLLGVFSYYPSNHGTKPSSNTSPNRYLARSSSSPPMATAMAATSTTTRYPPMGPSKVTSPSAKSAVLSPSLTELAVMYEDETEFMKRIEFEWTEREEEEKRKLFKEYVAEVEAQGYNAAPELLARLLEQYKARQAELDQRLNEEKRRFVEGEQSLRLNTLQRTDPDLHEKLQQLYLEQEIIMQTLQREQAGKGTPRQREKTAEERVREIQAEAEEQQRREQQEQWDWTDPHKREEGRRTQYQAQSVAPGLRERREKDEVEGRNRQEKERVFAERTTQIAEEAREGLRTRPSVSALRTETEPQPPRRATTLPTLSETSSRSSLSDGLWDSPATASTPTSSGFWSPTEAPSKPTSSRPVAVPGAEERQRTPSGSYGNNSRMPTSGSPLSGTPNSRDRATPERWIPPDSSREPTPTRKQSTYFDSSRESGPTRKASVLFGASPTPPPSASLDEQVHNASIPRQTTPHSATRESQSQPHTQPQYTRPAAPSYQPPPAPPARTQPLPADPPPPRTTPVHATATSTTTPIRQATYPQAQPTKKAAEQPTRSFSTSIPTSSSYTASSMPSSRPTVPEPSTSMPSSYSARPTTASATPFSSSVPNATSTKTPYGASSYRPATSAPSGQQPVYPNQYTSTSTKPTNANPKSPFSGDPNDEYRTKLRSEYKAAEDLRAEEERRRREQEDMAKRAEDARKRGEERRRMEELAREAERRDAEKRARKAGVPMPSGPERPVPEAWAAYESQWAAMASATQLRFRSIPWPVLAPISSPEQLVPVKIAGFILNGQHSAGKARKDRLKEALLRWHPDRFESKWLKKVVEEERDMVKEGVGNVVRVLNELLNAPDFG